METILQLNLLIIFYAYLGYPIILFLLSLTIRAGLQRKDIEPRVTFLITAYNEEKNIHAKLEDTLKLDYPKEKLEILVASDGSDDKTDDIVRAFQGRGVRLLRVEGRVGKTETQNQAVRAAQGEVIIFSDSTTKYEKNAIRKLVRNYADKNVGAASGRYRYFDTNSTQMGTGSITFWDYENFIKMRQTRINTITGCCGCIYSLRRSLYVDLPADIISDLVEPLKILEQGYRIVFEPEALAYETSTQASAEEFKMRVRVISRGMRGLLYVKQLFNPIRFPFVAFQLLSHKVLRWLVPWFALTLFLSSGALYSQNNFYAALFWLQGIFYLSAFLGWVAEKTGRKMKILSLPFYFCVVNLAAMIALIRTVRGQKAVTWSTVR